MEKNEAEQCISSAVKQLADILAAWISDYDSFGYETDLLDRLFNDYARRDINTVVNLFNDEFKQEIVIKDINWSSDISGSGNYRFNIDTKWCLETENKE